MHLAEFLWAEHAPPGGFPAGVLPVPEPIVGTAFFPGGYGLWNPLARRPLPDFPVGGVMVLGHDFHSEAGYRASLARGHERPTQPTWRNLLAFLAEVGIVPESCFFTNAYMGLRAGSATTGVFPGASDAAFVAHCRAFLRRQLEVQRPRLVLTLGVHAPRVLAPLSAQLAGWEAAGGLKHLDAVGPVRRGVRVDGVQCYATTVVALTHPSLRAAGVRHRRYAGLTGAEAELRMLRDGRTAASHADRAGGEGPGSFNSAPPPSAE